MRVVEILVGSAPASVRRAAGWLRWRSRSFGHAFDFVENRLRNCDGIIRQGIGQGLRFNTGGSNGGYLLGTSEPQMQFALQQWIKPGMCVYDVGANVGFFSVMAAKLTGSNGCVVCFEPLVENANQVTYNAELNDFSNISVRPEALGNEDGTASFLLSAVSTWGRLASAGCPNERTGEILVTLRRLDSLIAEAGLPPPDLIKVDIEGAEVDFLMGAIETIKRFQPILLIELHGTHQAALDTLSKINYHAQLLDNDGPILKSPWYAQIAAFPRGSQPLNSSQP